MWMKPIHLNNESKLMKDYRNESDQVMRHFDYSPFQAFEEKRIKALHKRSFNRIELSERLQRMNAQWGAPEATKKQIERLKDPNSVVIIGGQQAGVLTGPMYTINKIISIIHVAKEEEKKLAMPVIPVFWIAGEDHDFEEINHVWTPHHNNMKKHILHQFDGEKRPISDRVLDKTHFSKWFTNLLQQFNETVYTKEIHSSVMSCLEKSETYVDFFAQLLFQLFNDEGLVLIDSNAPHIRQLESEYFVTYIHKQPSVAEAVYKRNHELNQSGYYTSLDIEKEDAHLFYLLEGERILLQRSSDGSWVGKQNEVTFTTEEMIQIAKYEPELLSNNVVTRPLMQELLFPVLTFIGGPGEISYWSTLQPMFNSFDIDTPPVLPRLSLSYVDIKTEKMLKKLAISPEDALRHGVDEQKIRWLSVQKASPIDQMSAQIKKAIARVHMPLREAAKEIRTDVGELADKNLQYIYENIEFLEKKMYRAIEEQHENTIADFDWINDVLHPNGQLQERTWNILFFVNQFGSSFIKELINNDFSYEAEHYIVYL